ncbi:MAG: ornithine cyclodeaminase family protein [Burkholderiaceae bacterium]
MLLIDGASTRAALPFGALIAALRQMFVQGCEVPLRHTHVVKAPDGSARGTVLIMPAWQTGRYLGIKTVNIFPGNGARALPGLHASYVLYDASTGVPLALLDGNEITARRTAAASALAASYLAPAGAATLLVVGAGRVGSLLAEAYRAVRPIRRVLVWDRTPAHAQALVERLQADGIAAEWATDLAGAARSADVVSCATLATQPLLRGQWLAPGSHLDLIGSFAPHMREADDACFSGAQIHVDTNEALQKSGDLLEPLASGAIAPADVCGTLADLCRGMPRRGAVLGQRTVFKSVGSALEDLAAAVLVYESQPAVQARAVPPAV